MGSVFFTMLDYLDKSAGKTIYAERTDFFDYLLTKPREHIIDVIKHYNILKNPRFENYYRVLNIFIDACKNPSGKQIWEKFYK